MRNKLLITAVLASLVIVGAGCGPKATPPTPVTTLPSTQQNVTSDPVDSSVNAILGGTDQEAKALEGEAGDTTGLNAADGEVQAFSESAYEVK